MGGVESHLQQLSDQLLKMGHKVIIVTHDYGNRKGVRFMSNGLKVYYIPIWRIYEQVSFPTIYCTFPILRNIFIRESIDIVHGHQAFSPMCHESMIHAKTMGLKSVFTDHSLFGFNDISSILTNKLLKFTLTDVNHVICVSHTSKENTVLRASIEPSIVSVIPNAVVPEQFEPIYTFKSFKRITIVVASRLVYRKGVDLLVDLIPKVCSECPNVDFIVAGDGNKRVDLEQMREKHVLQDRVRMIGAVKHEKVRDVLVSGQIFLNTSLTEAFCIAIVEAASCGLTVVSTNVGGVPEVLSKDIIILSKPNSNDLLLNLKEAIIRVQNPDYDPWKLHQQVKTMYSWQDVATRTEKIYYKVVEQDQVDAVDRICKFYSSGLWSGKIACLIIAFEYLILYVLEFLFPSSSIDCDIIGGHSEIIMSKSHKKSPAFHLKPGSLGHEPNVAYLRHARQRHETQQPEGKQPEIAESEKQK